jgi:hypothetical protein
MNRLAPSPWTIQPNRAIELKDSLAVLNHGGPALLGYEHHTDTPYPIAFGDDQGIFVIVPVLSHWLGQSDPVAVLRSLWIASWSFTLLFSAVVFRSIFRSGWAAWLAPPTLLVCILSFGFGDIYWVAAWVAVTFMPLLIMLARLRPRGLWVCLASVALLAGVVTAIRSDAGLPVALAAMAVGALAAERWPRRVAVVAVVALAYLAPTLIGMSAIRAHRDHRVGVDLSAREPSSHAVWHSLYIGLGYTSNRYGIHYLDGYGRAAAKESFERETHHGSSADASSYLGEYGTGEERAVHRQFTTLIEQDPGFVASAELEKAIVELFLAAPYILLLALLAPTAVTAPGAAGLRRSELALFIPALVIGALPAIIAAPFRDYSLSLLGPLAALDLLAIGSLFAVAEAEWSTTASTAKGLVAHVRLLTHGLVRNGPGRATMRALLVALVILIPVSGLARHLEGEHNRWDRKERNPPTVVLASASAHTTAPHA